MNLIEKVFGTRSERELKVIRPIVTKIESLRPEMTAMSDEELRSQTRILRERFAEGATLDDVLPEAFATVREAARRTLSIGHFPVQLIGDIVLHQDCIAEARTGEGKTLISTCPAYLNTLKRKGVQIVTVNNYLAKHDIEWMGRVHGFLSMTVGVVLNDMVSEQCKETYACDVTYATNNELRFDYLHDNMPIYKEQLVLRDLDYCVIGEVDSVLIDEARTPFIISGQSGKSTKLYEVCDILAHRLERGTVSREFLKTDAVMGEGIEEIGDFVVDEKDKIVNLMEQGVKEVEEYFHIEDLADPEDLETQHNTILALRADNLMFGDRDHVVRDDGVLIVDEFTGRIMPGRHYSDGSHQAIEAKEHANVRRESHTLATVTFQDFFNKYTKKAGMTGTAQAEEKGFRSIYAMDVVVIPTNKPVIYKDLENAVYKTKKGKYEAVVDKMEKTHEKGQPVLVGTIAIETSELLSKILTKKGTPHKVLNARFHELEAGIVADAGTHDFVAVATSMAGRGTGIKLDEETKALGGLKIADTERHKSCRIDNQLCRRSGCQGDPGKSRFYLSLKDNLLRFFGSGRLMAMFETMSVPEGEQIEHKMLFNVVEKTQIKIKSSDYSVHEQLLKFDEVNNEQREVIYAERRRVLGDDNIRDLMLRMITDTVENAVDISASDDQTPDKWDLQELSNLLLPVIPLKLVTLTDEQKKFMKKNGLRHNLKGKAIKLYETEEAEFPEPEQIHGIERVVLLKVIDNKWMTYLDGVNAPREGIGLQTYDQRDPVVEYKMQGYEMYRSMMAFIQEETIRILLHIRMEQKVEREPAAKVTGMNRDAPAPSAPKKRVEQRIYLDGPCPYNSGKKYEQCHGGVR